MKRLLILLSVSLLVLTGGAWLTARMLIDAEALKQKLGDELQRISGQKVLLGDVSVGVFPTPRLDIATVYVRNNANTSKDNILEIEQLQLTLGWGALFSDEVEFSEISLHRVDMNLEYSRKGVSSLRRFIEGMQLESGEGLLASKNLWQSIRVDEGAVRYVDYVNDEEIYIGQVNADIGYDGNEGGLTLSASFELYGELFSIDGQLAPAGASGAAALPLSMAITHANTSLHLNGEVLTQGEKLSAFNGKLVFDTDNVLSMLGILKGKRFIDEQRELPAYALHVESDAQVQSDALVMKEAVIKGDGAQGKAGIAISYSGDAPNIRFKLDMEKFDLNTIVSAGLSRLLLVYPKLGEQPITYAQKQEAHEQRARYSLPENLSLKGVIRSKELSGWGVRVSDVVALMESGGGETISLSRLSGTLSGESKFLFSGMIKEVRNGLALEGQLKAKGKAFDQVLEQDLGWASARLPDEGYKDYALTSNVLISSDMIRFSELFLPIGDKKIQGSILRYLGQDSRTEAVLKLVNIDLDGLLSERVNGESVASVQSAAPEHAALQQEPGALPPPPPTKDEGTEQGADVQKNGAGLLQELLKRELRAIQGRYDLKLRLEDYTLGEEVQPGAELSLQMDNGRLAVQNFEATYKGSRFDGSVSVDVRQEMVKLSADMHVDEVNTEDYFPEQEDDTAAGDEKWSRSSLNTSYLLGYDSDFKIRIDRLYHGNAYRLNNVVLDGELRDRLLVMNEVKSGIWEGELRGKGKLSIGRFPTLQCSFNLLNIDVIALSQTIPFLNSIAGRFSLTGTLSTTGVSLYSWVTNAEGTIGIAARDILVKGLNLSGIVRAIGAVRKVSDVSRAIEIAYPGGNTMLLSVDGRLAVGGGKIADAGIDLKTEFGGGRVKGYLDLHNWLLDLLIGLQLDTFDRTNPPTLNIAYEGEVEAPKRRLDTSSVEAFAAKRAAAGLIEN